MMASFDVRLLCFFKQQCDIFCWLKKLVGLW